MNFTELRDSVAKSEVSLANVLRETKIFSYRLGENSFKQWVEYELKGYPNDANLPAYRRHSLPSLGTFVAGYGYQVKNYILPTFSLPPELKTMADEVGLPQGIHEIEQIALRKQEMSLHWPAEAVMLARSYIKLANGAQLVEAYHVLPHHLFEGILDAARNHLLDFLLELEQAHPEVAQGVAGAKNIPREDVAQIFHFTIQGDHNVIASGHSVSQSVNQTVTPHDLNAVLRVARELNVSEEDVKDLQNAIKADKTPKQKEFGLKVKAWLGKATEKLATGAWQTTLQTAPSVIAKAIAAYYGWK